MSDITELMSRDPLLLTKSDITEIVRVMRESRGKFAAGNMKAGSTKPLTEKAKTINSLATALKVNL